MADAGMGEGPVVFGDGVELIDVVTPGKQPRRPRPAGVSRRWGAALIALAVAVAAGGIVAWQPWHQDHKTAPLRFTPDAMATPTLTDHLVLGDPNAAGYSLAGSSIPDPKTPSLGSFGDLFPTGYLWAAPNADFNKGPGLVFEHMKGGGSEDPGMSSLISVVTDTVDTESAEGGDNNPGSDTSTSTPVVVAGHPAEIDEHDGSIDIQWQVGNDWYFVAGMGVGRDQALRLANSVSLDGDTTVVSDPHALDGLQPVGSVRGLFQLLSMISPIAFGDTSTEVSYGARASVIAVTSAPATQADIGPMLSFVLSDTRPATVHGTPAVVGVAPAEALAPSFGRLATVVVWQEGGRMVAVVGNVDRAKLLALAESVRPATETEWAAVVAINGNQPDSGDGQSDDTLPASGAIILGQGTDPVTGKAWTASVGFGDSDPEICVRTGDPVSGVEVCHPMTVGPSFATEFATDIGVVVVAGNDDTKAVLRVTMRSGETEDHVADENGLIAVLLPAGATYELIAAP